MESQQPKANKTQERTGAPNLINVSNKRNAKFYVYLGKQILKDHQTIQLHALGNAVSTSVQAAENLVRNNYATFKQIKTETVDVENNQKKAKLFITLEKHADFDANIAKFELIKQENEKLNQATPQ
ncbi:uncharacterized protein at2g34160-like [Stylonychia lemnae]|uniref:Uncharacterized protein at2g34160-like n=1 Tax=Stylonychia lemnae TaxID=5949 RepID=A0A078AA36_STYLE|nr:uncharacterized protein at2g34160-like [Stylonychia lemnae]|eukprot:CDW77678.1 uncharacterized protein at2g34160-like [Stylonychia lemnae]